MINQSDIREKFRGFKGGIKKMWSKAHFKTEKINVNEAPETREYPSDSVGTAPRTSRPLSSEATFSAQKLVWDNEDASMQDKSYLFDEVTTDDNEVFRGDEGEESEQESRYK